MMELEPVRERVWIECTEETGVYQAAVNGLPSWNIRSPFVVNFHADVTGRQIMPGPCVTMRRNRTGGNIAQDATYCYQELVLILDLIQNRPNLLKIMHF